MRRLQYIALAVLVLFSVRAFAYEGVSSEGIAMIKSLEGLKLKMYRDSAGYPTIGYGHLIKKGEFFSPAGINERQAEVLLRQDLKVVESAMKRLIVVKMSRNQYDALASLIFNIGVGAFAKSTLLKHINNAERDKATREFGRWIFAGGKVSKGLAKRRLIEQGVFIGTTKST